MNASEYPIRSRSENRQKVTDVEIDQIKESLEGLRFGTLQIIVQDGVIVQIDRTEKRRLHRPNEKA